MFIGVFFGSCLVINYFSSINLFVFSQVVIRRLFSFCQANKACYEQWVLCRENKVGY